MLTEYRAMLGGIFKRMYSLDEARLTASSRERCRLTSTSCREAPPVQSSSGRLPGYLTPTTIESGPTRCSTRVDEKPASRIHPAQSAPV